jgi:hypothetical protein
MGLKQRTRFLFGIAAIAILAWSCDDDNPAAPPPDDDNPTLGDTTPPQAVADLSLAVDPATHDVRFTWTAPRDDAERDRVAQYQIRYSYTFPMDWWTAEAVPDPPAPAVEGSAQEYAFVNATRGSDFYAAIRTIDEAGHRSEMSSVAYVRVPGFSFEALCLDAMSQVPVAGLDVRITERYAHHFVTGLDGRVAVPDIAEGPLTLRLDAGGAAATYHSLGETFGLNTDRAIVYPMIEFVLTDLATYDNVLDLLIESITSFEPILKKWRSLPVAWYAPAFVNVHGVDYTDLARNAAARWNEAIGVPLFVAVDTPPAIGVTMEFLPAASMGGQNGITSYTSDAEGYPVLDRIRIVDAFADTNRLYSVMLHELGHTIRLGHLNNPSYIMFASQPLPSDISTDEIRAVQLRTALPNGIDLGIYDLAPSR